MRFRFLLLGVFALFALTAFAQDDASTDDTSTTSSDSTDISGADDSATWAPVTDDGTGGDSSASAPSDDGTSSDSTATSPDDSFATSNVDTSATAPADASLGGTSVDGSTDGSNGDSSLGSGSLDGASLDGTSLSGSSDDGSTQGSINSGDASLGGSSIGSASLGAGSSDGITSGGSLLDGTSLGSSAPGSAPASDTESDNTAERFAHRGLLRRAPSSNAPIVSNNPPGTQYTAKLPDRNDTTVRGAININTNGSGNGTNVQVSISGLPDKGGPFMYHIHQYPIVGLNCTTAGAHLDPYGVTESPPCDPTQPDKCQIGDLSGKHGNMTGPSYSANYVDLYISTQENTPAFAGNLSIVVHASDKKRLTCANLILQGCRKFTCGREHANDSACFVHLHHIVLDFSRSSAGDSDTACANADRHIFDGNHGGAGNDAATYYNVEHYLACATAGRCVLNDYCIAWFTNRSRLNDYGLANSENSRINRQDRTNSEYSCRDLNTSIVTLHPHPAPTVSITSDVTASPIMTDAPAAAPTMTTTYTPSAGGVVKNSNVAAMNLGCALVAIGAWFL